jgi:polysaccharide pyruvyl transferase WcaK-like protein
MRFVVFGGWFGSGNLGDDSILIGLKRALMQVVRDPEIVAVSSDPDQTRRTCGVEAIPLLSPLGRLRRDGSSVEAYHEAFRESDACVISGGTPIYDYGYASRLLHFGFPTIMGRRLFCFGMGVKPIRSRMGVSITRELLGWTELISTRDRLSRDELVRIGVDRPIAVTGDSALFLTPCSYAVGLERLVESGVDTDRPMVAVCPRALSNDYRKHYHASLSQGAILSIRDAVAAVADHLSDAGYEVVFIPMHRSPYDDDLEEIRVVQSLMRGRSTRVIDVGMEPAEAMAVLGRMSLVLGLRLHSLILAAAQGVPVVGVDYDRKIRGFMELAGVGEFLCLPSEPPRAFVERVEMGLNGAEVVRDRLLRSCCGMKKRILDEAGRLVAALG